MKNLTLTLAFDLNYCREGESEGGHNGANVLGVDVGFELPTNPELGFSASSYAFATETR